jgi:hypothetical protein
LDSGFKLRREVDAGQNTGLGTTFGAEYSQIAYLPYPEGEESEQWPILIGHPALQRETSPQG